MTDIALHAHTNAGWVSWRVGRTGFGAIHLERPAQAGITLCDLLVPSVGRVVRNQDVAAIEDLCRNCLKEYARGAHA